MYNGAEQLLAYFQAHDKGSEAERARRRSTLLPLVVTCIFGIEVGLKALIVEQGDRPARTHDLLKLFENLECDARDKIELRARSAGLNAKSVGDLLRAHRDSLQEWRYRGEDSGVLVIAPGDVLLTLRSILEVHQETYGGRASQSEQSPAAESEVPASVLRASSEYIKSVIGTETGGD